MLRVHELGFAYSEDQWILRSLTLQFESKLYALVGDNGSGKSTFLRILARRMLPTEGLVQCEGTLVYLSQMAEAPLAAEFPAVYPLFEAARMLERGDTSPELWDFLETRWDELARLKQDLDAWGCASAISHPNLQDLSPGTSQRLRLLFAFFLPPDLLLLDEPSNHLDEAGRARLRESLRRHRGTVLLASHDRTLLEEAEVTLELADCEVTQFGGPYSFYREQRDGHEAAKKAQWEASRKELRKVKRKAQEVLERQQKRSRNADRNQDKLGLPKILLGARERAAEDSLGRLKKQHEARIADHRLKHQEAAKHWRKESEIFVDLKGDTGSGGKVVLSLHDLNHSYDRGLSWLWPQSLFFQLRGGERWAITGRNGCGKSSLLALIRGEQKVLHGELAVNAKQVLTLDQTLSFLTPGLSLRQLWQTEDYEDDESRKRTLAARIGLAPELLDRPCETMSGGQRMRAALVLIAAKKQLPDLLLLDEPSNHLDIETIESLTETLLQLPTTIIVVSHDRSFLEDLELDGELCLDA